MIELRKASERGPTKIGWLDSKHTFSFGQYYDSKHMGFRALRVINEDRVIPGAGFGTHGHQDMEIVSYVLEGALAHQDSTGTSSVIRPGEIQRMSAGTGVQHSEMNPSKSEPVHFLQIWILPERNGLPPSYEQKLMPEVKSAAQLDLVGSRDGSGSTVTIHQDVKLYRANLRDGAKLDLPLTPGRHAWLQVARGAVTVNGADISAGDGLTVSAEAKLSLAGRPEAEVLIFDLA
ncbi:MAG: pirin family protein [Gammaproteobacteria bacterium]|nr:pirin family protein [Gammaproteobacteria bacterium]MBU6510215.1 pirin family protein [Gammaproteobacteria bacterium]MDE1984679.1 pirin family protein [Gammaproteobacteria bacterium]MDE2460855.1 pirin family protein [Gammaproteobacteria bacterium]